ncbi:Glycoside hydrolase family 3 protein [Mycena kentingensis (nom. inval.)]|nr:Glycoside hydrolase family 3 protein [Mycena kentingensis (nom. inval.)]
MICPIRFEVRPLQLALPPMCMLWLQLLLAAAYLRHVRVRAFGFPDCVAGPLANTTVCDASASPVDRASALIAMWTDDELVANTNVGAPGVPRLGVPAYQAAEEALHGLAASPGVIFATSGDFSSATSFPAPIHMSAAFDDAAIQAVGDVISTEARAFSNAERAGLDYFTPNINPFRDPRWGRGQETPGEDAFRAGQYAYHFVVGLQGGVDPKQIKIAADCKHFAGYDLENPPGTNRFIFNAVLSPQDLADYYTVPFQSCVRDAKAMSVMCAFNAVNGEPSCASPYLLNTLLRGFYGLDEERWIVADCDAIEFLFDQRHAVPDFTHAAALGMNSGTDLDCGTTYGDHLGDALSQGLVNTTRLRQALTRQYASFMRLGYFDPPDAQPYRQLSWSDVNTPDAQHLAYQIAADGLVLLKNIDNTLPLAPGGKTLAIIGPLSVATTQMQSNYAGPAPFLITPLAGAQGSGFASVLQAAGTGGNTQDTSGFADALAKAKQADIVVYAGGLDTGCCEAEGQDRATLTWPGNQLDLIEQLAAVGKPFIVLQLGGGQVDDAALKTNPNVSAIVWAGYPGQSGGKAIFDVLTGKVAPSGRLPVTQYPSAYADQVPMTDMTLRPSANNPGRTYKWYTGEPTFEFGFGLSYTTFDVDFATAPKAAYDIQALVDGAGNPVDRGLLDTFEVKVSNAGSVTSDFVALLFVNTTAGPTPFPNKSLVSYGRAKGVGNSGTKTVQLPVTLGSIARADEDGNLWLYPGHYGLLLDVPTRLVRAFELTGTAAQISEWPKQ